MCDNVLQFSTQRKLSLTCCQICCININHHPIHIQSSSNSCHLSISPSDSKLVTMPINGYQYQSIHGIHGILTLKGGWSFTKLYRSSSNCSFFGLRWSWQPLRERLAVSPVSFCQCWGHENNAKYRWIFFQKEISSETNVIQRHDEISLHELDRIEPLKRDWCTSPGYGVQTKNKKNPILLSSFVHVLDRKHEFVETGRPVLPIQSHHGPISSRKGHRILTPPARRQNSLFC